MGAAITGENPKGLTNNAVAPPALFLCVHRALARRAARAQGGKGNGLNRFVRRGSAARRVVMFGGSCLFRC